MNRWKIKWSDTEKRIFVDGIDVSETITSVAVTIDSFSQHQVTLTLVPAEMDWTMVDDPQAAQ